jgi:hypothetical protein
MRALPDVFVNELAALPKAYLQYSDPIRSRTRHEPAFDAAEFMTRAGLSVAGSGSAGAIPEARFAWIDLSHHLPRFFTPALSVRIR